MNSFNVFMTINNECRDDHRVTSPQIPTDRIEYAMRSKQCEEQNTGEHTQCSVVQCSTMCTRVCAMRSEQSVDQNKFDHTECSAEGITGCEMSSLQCASKCSVEHTARDSKHSRRSGPFSYQKNTQSLETLFHNKTEQKQEHGVMSNGGLVVVGHGGARHGGDKGGRSSSDHNAVTSPPTLVTPQLLSSPSFDSFQHFCVIDTEETGNEPMNFKNFSSQKPNKDLYRNFLEECKLAFKGNKISIGCNICDQRVSNFANGRELNSFYLKNLVKFKKNDDGIGGSFVYSRRHKPSIACLPSGYSQAAARLA